jgi:hypothetical protein
LDRVIQFFLFLYGIFNGVSAWHWHWCNVHGMGKRCMVWINNSWAVSFFMYLYIFFAHSGSNNITITRTRTSTTKTT